MTPKQALRSVKANQDRKVARKAKLAALESARRAQEIYWDTRSMKMIYDDGSEVLFLGDPRVRVHRT